MNIVNNNNLKTQTQFQNIGPTATFHIKLEDISTAFQNHNNENKI